MLLILNITDFLVQLKKDKSLLKLLKLFPSHLKKYSFTENLKLNLIIILDVFSINKIVNNMLKISLNMMKKIKSKINHNLNFNK